MHLRILGLCRSENIVIITNYSPNIIIPSHLESPSIIEILVISYRPFSSTGQIQQPYNTWENRSWQMGLLRGLFLGH